MAWIIGTILVLLLIDLCVHIHAVRLSLPLFESPLPFTAKAAERDPDAQDYSFPTLKGSRQLQGSLLTPNAPPTGIVLFCHEYEGNRWTARNYCEGLLNAGYAIFTFDFCNHGESDSQPRYRPLTWLTEYEVHDVLSAIHFIKQQPEWSRLPLVLFGVSKGAGAALSAAARTRAVDGIIVESPYSTPRLMSLHVTRWIEYVIGSRIVSWIPRWHVELTLKMIRWTSQWRGNCKFTHLERDLRGIHNIPMLWISGARDNYVKPEVVRELCQIAGGDVSTDAWLVPGARHNAARHASEAEYDRRLLQFLAQIAKPMAPYHMEVDQIIPTTVDDEQELITGHNTQTEISWR